MVIYQFRVENDGKDETYSIHSTMKSKGYKSGYRQVETWQVIEDSTQRVMRTSYGKGLNTILKCLETIKQQAERYTVLIDWKTNPSAQS